MAYIDFIKWNTNQRLKMKHSQTRPKKSSYFQKLSNIIFIGLIVEMLMQMFLFCCQSLIYVEQKVIALKLNEV